MFPAFGYNHAYPQGRPHMSSDHHHHHHHPVSEGLPPQMKMEASNAPFVYGTWPHHYGYPVPTQCHSCCNHNPYPSYYPYRPSYPHFPSPPPHSQCYGGYPEPYAFHYPPPPHYTMDLPNYEYDKSMPREFHCCGCRPHHKVDLKGDKSVKIEEHEPEAVNKEESLIHFGSNNLRHPIVWIPPDYMKKPHQAYQNTLQQPNPMNGWTPLDYESIRRMLEGGDGRRLQDQQNKRRVNPGEGEVADNQEGPSVMIPRQDIKRILEGGEAKKSQDHQEGPCVMIPRQDLKTGGQEPKALSGWMPLDMDGLKKLLQNGNFKKDHDDQPNNQSHQKPFPMIWLPCDNGEKAQTINKSDATTSSESPRQVNDHIQKTIPTSASGAKETEGGQISLEKIHRPPKIIPVKQMDEPAIMKMEKIEDNKKSSENITKSKPSSPTKVSKLPPICLRVDPPKKKNGQGKSRSSSPPVNKVQHVDAVKPSSSMSENKSKGVQFEAENKSIEVQKQAKYAEDVGEKPKSQETVEKKLEEAQKPEKKIMSGTEAATVIQAAYRGYEVRRWEPLKKMKQIANIRDEAVALKRSIESGASTMELKQKTSLGEAIMNLLLKLDTIQGLHSSIRDMRKSVSKELVSLQEMLDTIVIKQTPDESATTIEKNTKDKSADESAEGSVETDKSTKDQISSSKELPVEEISTVMGPEQALPDKVLETGTSEKGAMGIAEEAAVENLAEKIEQEPSPDVVEVHVDSADQADMDHDLLAELPVAVVEEDSPESTTVCSSAENGKQVNLESELSQTVIEGYEPSATETETTICSSPEMCKQVNLESELAQTVDEGFEPSATAPETTICSSAEKSEQVNLESEPAQTVNEDFEPPVTEPEKLESQEASKGEIPAEQEAESITPQNVDVPVNDGEKDVNLTETAIQESADLRLLSELAASVQSDDGVKVECDDHTQVAMEIPRDNEALKGEIPDDQEAESKIAAPDVPVNDEETETTTHESEMAADITVEAELGVKQPSEADDQKQATVENLQENEGDEKEVAKLSEHVDSNPLELDARSAEEDARSAVPMTEDVVRKDENERSDGRE